MGNAYWSLRDVVFAGFVCGCFSLGSSARVSSQPKCCTVQRNSHPRKGICVTSDNLDAACGLLEITASPDCGADNLWCCFDPSAGTETKPGCTESSAAVDDLDLLDEEDEIKNRGGGRRAPDRRMRGSPRKRRDVMVPTPRCRNITKPLILTSLLQAGNISFAQQQSRVTLKGSNLTSYSGYFTVNATDASQMFFWFFEAEVPDPTIVPTILYLSGGPGSSSLFGAFVEMGPFRVDENLTLSLLKNRWTKVANMLFMDNPIGTGFSFTNSTEGYSKNEDQVDANLYQAVSQFFRMFPNYSYGDFYLAGESYAAKFVVSLAVKIYQENPGAAVKIPLVGLLMGNGYIDPVNQERYGDILYQVGMINSVQRRIFLTREADFVRAVQEGRYADAVDIDNSITQGDTSLFFNLTKSENYYTNLYTEEPAEFYYFDDYVNQCSVRTAIHVGSQVFADLSDKVFNNLVNDYAKSAADKLVTALGYYRVLLYNGIQDIIVNHPTVEAYLEVINWTGRDGFLAAPKYAWKVKEDDAQIAGYIQQYQNLSLVAVRRAGHIVCYDRPRYALDLIRRFINHESFVSPSANCPDANITTC